MTTAPNMTRVVNDVYVFDVELVERRTEVPLRLPTRVFARMFLTDVTVVEVCDLLLRPHPTYGCRLLREILWRFAFVPLPLHP